MPDRFQTLINEPRAPGAIGPRRGDWVLVALVTVAAVAEGVLSDAVSWPWLSVPVIVALSFTLPWRRVHPFGVVFIAYTTTGLIHLTSGFLGVHWNGPAAALFLVILPYALLRWGTGQEALLGFTVIALSLATTVWNNQLNWGETLGAGLFLLFPAALGASVRFRDSANRRAYDQIRFQERAQLARELHDSVAHYVSAIAVQAQAGQALAATQPNASADALALIEEAASRALSDMRRIVGALRDERDTPLEPAAGLADLPRLEATSGAAQVKVSVDGALNHLDTALDTSLFRLAQEAVTNAQRHARGAANVHVRVVVDTARVTLTIEDDGDAITAPYTPGFGLRGMAERVSLLGGTLRAEPNETRGWRVEAILPLSKRAP
ncbi:MAG: histidine kinase [Pseudomonadota bacterium]